MAVWARFEYSTTLLFASNLICFNDALVVFHGPIAVVANYAEDYKTNEI
jgi:hypothetical protein